MTTRRPRSRRLHQLLVGALGLSVMLAGGALPAAATEPAAADPITTEPVAAEPITTEPVAAEPAVAASDPSQPAPVAANEAGSAVTTDDGPPQAPVAVEVTPTHVASVALAEAPFTVTGNVHTASGTPLAGATIALSGGGVSDQATTDAVGNYSLTAVSGGHSLAMTTNVGGGETRVQAAVTVNGAAPTLDLTVPDLVTVALRVRDLNDLPVEGASVGTYFAGDAVSTFQITPGASATGTAKTGGVSDADGIARLVSFPLPNYRDINVSKAFEGYTASIQLHNVSGSTSRTLDVGLSGQILPPGAPDVWSVYAPSPGVDESLFVRWNAPATNGGAPIKSYTAVAGPNGAECSTTALSCTITGLEGGRSYSVNVTAANVAGSSVPSATRTPIVPAKWTRPTPPASVTASPGVNEVAISWAPPVSDGGRSVTRYDVNVYDATMTPVSSCSTTGQLTCTARQIAYGDYTASVVATNSIGSSDASAQTAPFRVDAPAPTASLTGPSDANNTSFRLTFSDMVSGLDATDFTVTGTASDCVVAVSQNSWWMDGFVSVHGCSDGTVALTLKADSAAAASGKAGPANAISAGAIVDRVAPSTPVISAALRTGVSLSGGTVPLTLTWRASTDAGAGLAAKPYQLYRSYCGGILEDLGTYATTSLSLNQAVRNCSTTYYIYAIDAAGNTSAFAHTEDVLPFVHQHAYGRFSAGWTTASSKSYSGGSTKVAKVAGRSASFDTYGRTIAIVATKGPTRGKVKVYVNGAYQATVDLRAGATQYRTIAWQKSWSSAAQRTVKLVVAGTPGRPTVDLDAVVVLN